jgi:hypothetical protein
MADTGPDLVNDRDFTVELWKDLRRETLHHMSALNHTIWLITSIMAVTLALSAYPPLHQKATVFAVVMGSFAPYSMARWDLLLHRPAGAVADIETTLKVKGWENFYKSRLFWGKALLVPLDLLAAGPIIFLFWYANGEMWLLFASAAYYWTAWITFMVGIVFIALSSMLASK